MNSLSPQRPLLIVTIGIPGAGKSFFARRFSDTFAAPLVSFDEIRSTLFETAAHSSEEDFVVARIAGLQLRELFKSKKTVIIDGGHNPKVSRMELGRVARTHGYDVLYIWVQADERIAKSRALHRHGNKADDSYNRSLTEEEFALHAKRFTPPLANENVAVVSGHHTYATQARAILKRIATPHDTPQKPAPKRPTTQPPTQGRRSVTIN